MANGALTTPVGTQTPGLAQILRQDLSPQYQGFQIPKYTQSGMNVLEQLTTSGLQQLPNVSELGYQPTADWATQQFREKVLPGISGGFHARGGPHRGYGSALPEALARSARDFGLGLASKKGDFELAKHNAIRQQLELGLRPQYETAIQPVQPEPPTPWETFRSQFARGAGDVAPQFAAEGIKGLANWFSSPQAQDIPQEGVEEVKRIAATNSWGDAMKKNVSSWGPTVAGVVGKIGVKGAAGLLGIPAAAAGIIYLLYRAVGGSGHHHHRRK